jgi:hypothetical protein
MVDLFLREGDGMRKTLVQFKPVACRTYVGGRNSPTSQPTSPDFIGSDAIAICST